MQDILMEINNLSYRYEDGTLALDQVSLQIRRHERLAIMGSNGSGKSTLFLNLNGVYRPTDGQILYDAGRSITPAKDCWSCGGRSASSFRTRITSFSVPASRGKSPSGFITSVWMRRRSAAGWTQSARSSRSTRSGISPPTF